MRRFVPLLLSALLAACAVTPRPAVVPGAAIDPQQVTDWSASGRMAVAVADQGGSGNFEWTQHGATTDLQVRGPLGAGALHIVTDGERLDITDGDDRNLDAAAAREQLRVRLGADLPLAEMRYWLLGLPAPGGDARVAEGARGTRTVEQAGWTVTYEPFQNVAGWAVPTRLVVANDGGHIKVIVDGWKLPGPVPGATPGSGP
jgi:outer membrane lipoprotein LolB